MRVKMFAAMLCLCIAGAGHAQRLYDDDGEEVGTNKKLAIELPSAPMEANLLEFDGGPIAANRYFVDGTSIVIGKDAEVRFTLVIKTQGGAANVSYEGINCGDRQFKVYYLGRSDGSWTKPYSSRWSPIEKQTANPYRQVLYRDIFCSMGVVANADEARHALRRMRPAATSGAQ